MHLAFRKTVLFIVAQCKKCNSHNSKEIKWKTHSVNGMTKQKCTSAKAYSEPKHKLKFAPGIYKTISRKDDEYNHNQQWIKYQSTKARQINWQIFLIFCLPLQACLQINQPPPHPIIPWNAFLSHFIWEKKALWQYPLYLNIQVNTTISWILLELIDAHIPLYIPPIRLLIVFTSIFHCPLHLCWLDKKFWYQPLWPL